MSSSREHLLCLCSLGQHPAALLAHTHTHTNAHAYTFTTTHTHTHTHMLALTHTYTHRDTHAHPQTGRVWIEKVAIVEGAESKGRERPTVEMDDPTDRSASVHNSNKIQSVALTLCCR